MSSVGSLITYTDKTNVNAIVDRTKQSTAEDWQEVKDTINTNAVLLHRESTIESLVDGNTSHTITFPVAFEDADIYVKFDVYTEETDAGDVVRNSVATKAIVYYADKFTFKTYARITGLKCDYFAIHR